MDIDLKTNDIGKLCVDCGHICSSLSQCKKYQDFNIIVEHARAMAKLRHYLKQTTPYFRGKSSYFSDVPSGIFEEKCFFQGMKWNTRFCTITFDPKKFSVNELTQPIKLHNYTLNCIADLKHLFSKNIILIREYHKSGVPHYHLNYECASVHEHAHLILRLRYYFSKDLKNKRCIHDRYFNDGGIQYMRKSNESFIYFSIFNPPAPENENPLLIKFE